MTRNGIDTFLAENVMGWTKYLFLGLWCSKVDGRAEAIMGCAEWAPTGNLNHAFECLRAIDRGWTLTDDEFGLHSTEDPARQAEFRKHDNTRNGVCLAICVAICADRGWVFSAEEVIQ